MTCGSCASARGDHDLLAFSVAKFGHGAVCKRLHADGSDRPLHYQLVLRRQSAHPVSVRMSSQRHQCIGRQNADFDALCEHHAQALCQFDRTKMMHIVAHEQNAPLERCLHPGQRADGSICLRRSG
jgi:hypothetical protein